MEKKRDFENLFLAYNTPGHPECPQKNVSTIGPVVWAAIGNIYIYTNVLFYYIDLCIMYLIFT